MPLVEVCVEGLASALAAGKGGAGRVELCENLAAGGVTPGPGAIAVACRRLAVPVHVLIRPRGGDFVYGEAEREAMRLDVEAAKAAGAAGVVLGLLRRDGAVDREQTARLIDAARPMSVTFHRAFDATPNLVEALDALIALGVDRVLTSGGGARAIDGLGRLVELQRRAAGRLRILAGGGIAVPEVDAFVAAGLREIHVGSAATLGDRSTTDAGAVRRIIERVAQAAVRAGRASADNGPVAAELPPAGDGDGPRAGAC